MGENITDRPIKRVLVLVEMADGAIGAAYSEDPNLDAKVDLRFTQGTNRAPWDESRVIPQPTQYAVNIGPLRSLVIHDPAFHDPAVEAMAHAVMDQWKRGNG